MFWKQISIINIIVTLGMLVFLTTYAPEKQLAKNLESNTIQITDGVPENNNINTQIILEAGSACVFDQQLGNFLFEINKNTQLPLASLTKLMTAVVAKENLPADAEIEITNEALAQEGDVGLITGEKWRLNDLINIMLITSSNDAAYAISSSLNTGENNYKIFIKLMNEKANELGLKQTFFLNATGLDYSKNIAGAYGSCEDITKLLTYIIQTQAGMLDTTAQDYLTVNDEKFLNTNILTQKIPFLIGGKNGYSDLAGGNLAIICNKNINNPIIIVVLGSSFDGRFKDTEKLYNNFIYGFGHN